MDKCFPDRLGGFGAIESLGYEFDDLVHSVDQALIAKFVTSDGPGRLVGEDPMPDVGSCEELAPSGLAGSWVVLDAEEKSFAQVEHHGPAALTDRSPGLLPPELERHTASVTESDAITPVGLAGIEDPQHPLSVVRLPSRDAVDGDAAVLEFDNAIGGAHDVGAVIANAHFAALRREQTLIGEVPFSKSFRPSVAVGSRDVCPMPDVDFPALGDHRASTEATSGQGSRGRSCV